VPTISRRQFNEALRQATGDAEVAPGGRVIAREDFQRVLGELTGPSQAPSPKVKVARPPVSGEAVPGLAGHLQPASRDWHLLNVYQWVRRGRPHPVPPEVEKSLRLLGKDLPIPPMETLEGEPIFTQEELSWLNREMDRVKAGASPKAKVPGLLGPVEYSIPTDFGLEQDLQRAQSLQRFSPLTEEEYRRAENLLKRYYPAPQTSGLGRIAEYLPSGIWEPPEEGTAKQAEAPEWMVEAGYVPGLSGEEAKKRFGPLTLAETFRPQIPVYDIIKQTQHLVPLVAAAERLAKAGRDYYYGREADENLLGHYILWVDQQQTRGETTGAMVGQIVSAMPSWMISFLIATPAAAFAKGLVRKAARRVLRRWLRQRLVRWGIRVGAGAVAGAARATMQPHLLLQERVKRGLPHGMTFTPQGELLWAEAAEKPATAWLKAFARIAIANMSETAGDPAQKVAGVMARSAGRGVAAKLGAMASRLSPRARAMFATIGNALRMAVEGSARLRNVYKQLGYHGVLAEMGEERLEDILTAVTGVSDEYRGVDLFERLVAAVPSGQQLLAEALGFGVAGASRAAAGTHLALARGALEYARLKRDAAKLHLSPEALSQLRALADYWRKKPLEKILVRYDSTTRAEQRHLRELEYAGYLTIFDADEDGVLYGWTGKQPETPLEGAEAAAQEARTARETTFARAVPAGGEQGILRRPGPLTERERAVERTVHGRPSESPQAAEPAAPRPAEPTPRQQVERPEPVASEPPKATLAEAPPLLLEVIDEYHRQPTPIALLEIWEGAGEEERRALVEWLRAQGRTLPEDESQLPAELFRIADEFSRRFRQEAEGVAPAPAEPVAPPTKVERKPPKKTPEKPSEPKTETPKGQPVPTAAAKGKLVAPDIRGTEVVEKVQQFSAALHEQGFKYVGLSRRPEGPVFVVGTAEEVPRRGLIEFFVHPGQHVEEAFRAWLAEQEEMPLQEPRVYASWAKGLLDATASAMEVKRESVSEKLLSPAIRVFWTVVRKDYQADLERLHQLRSPGPVERPLFNELQTRIYDVESNMRDLLRAQTHRAAPAKPVIETADHLIPKKLPKGVSVDIFAQELARRLSSAAGWSAAPATQETEAAIVNLVAEWERPANMADAQAVRVYAVKLAAAAMLGGVKAVDIKALLARARVFDEGPEVWQQPPLNGLGREPSIEAVRRDVNEARRRAELPADHVITPSELARLPGMHPSKTLKTITARLRAIMQAVPEFAIDSSFEVETRAGEADEAGDQLRLVYRDNYRLAFQPSYLGIDESNLKVGQRVRFDLREFGLKVDAAVRMANNLAEGKFPFKKKRRTRKRPKPVKRKVKTARRKGKPDAAGLDALNVLGPATAGGRVSSAYVDELHGVILGADGWAYASNGYVAVRWMRPELRKQLKIESSDKAVLVNANGEQFQFRRPDFGDAIASTFRFEDPVEIGRIHVAEELKRSGRILAAVKDAIDIEDVPTEIVLNRDGTLGISVSIEDGVQVANVQPHHVTIANFRPQDLHRVLTVLANAGCQEAVLQLGAANERNVLIFLGDQQVEAVALVGRPDEEAFERIKEIFRRQRQLPTDQPSILADPTVPPAQGEREARTRREATYAPPWLSELGAETRERWVRGKLSDQEVVRAYLRPMLKPGAKIHVAITPDGRRGVVVTPPAPGEAPSDLVSGFELETVGGELLDDLADARLSIREARQEADRTVPGDAVRLRVGEERRWPNQENNGSRAEIAERPDDQPVSPEEIPADLAEDWPPNWPEVSADYFMELMELCRRFGLKPRWDRLRPEYLGLFRPLTHEVTTRNLLFTRTLAHETGHGFDYLLNERHYPPQIRRRFQMLEGRVDFEIPGERALRAELHSVSRECRPWLWSADTSEYMRRYARKHTELMADFWSMFLIAPERAEQLAPTITRLIWARLADFPKIEQEVRRTLSMRFVADPTPPIIEQGFRNWPWLRSKFRTMSLPETLEAIKSKDWRENLKAIPINAERQYRASVYEAQRRAERIRQLVPDMERQQWLRFLVEWRHRDLRKFLRNLKDEQRSRLQQLPWWPRVEEMLESGKTPVEVIDALSADERRAIVMYQGLMELMRQQFNQYVMDIGVKERKNLIAWVQDYFMHSYEREITDLARRQIRQWIKWRKRSPQQSARVIPTIEEAVAVGLRPRVTTLHEGLGLWATVNYRVMTTIGLLRFLSRFQIDPTDPSDVDYAVMKPSDRPTWPRRDYKPLRIVYAHAIERGPKREKIILWEGGVAVHPKAVALVDALFSSMPTNWFARAIGAVNAMMKAVQMTLFPTFHGQAEMYSAHGALGWRTFPGWWGQRAKQMGGKRLFGVGPYRVGILQLGKQLTDYPRFVQDAIEAGLVPLGYAPGEYIGTLQRALGATEWFLKDLFSDRDSGLVRYLGLPVYGTVKAVRKLHQFMQEMLWNNVSRAKFATFYLLTMEMQNKYPSIRPQRLKQIIAQYCNDNFGGQEWLALDLWRNPKFRWSMYQLFRSADWTLSQLRTARWPFVFAHGGRTGTEAALMRHIGLRHWVRNLFYLGVYTLAMNYILAGKPFWENEPGHQLDIDYTRAWRAIDEILAAITGRPNWKQRGDLSRRYFAIGKAAREVLRWGEAPARSLGSKMSPLANAVAEQLFGHKIGDTWMMPWVQDHLEGPEMYAARAQGVLEKFKPFVFGGNQAFLSFPAKKGMTHWKAVRAYLDLFVAQAEMARSGAQRAWAVATRPRLLLRSREKLERDIRLACEANNVDWKLARKRALNIARNRYYNRYWREAKRQATTKGPQARSTEKADSYVRALVALGVLPENIVRSMRSRDLPDVVKKFAIENWRLSPLTLTTSRRGAGRPAGRPVRRAAVRTR